MSGPPAPEPGEEMAPALSPRAGARPCDCPAPTFRAEHWRGERGPISPCLCPGAARQLLSAPSRWRPRLVLDTLAPPRPAVPGSLCDPRQAALWSSQVPGPGGGWTVCPSQQWTLQGPGPSWWSGLLHGRCCWADTCAAWMACLRCGAGVKPWAQGQPRHFLRVPGKSCQRQVRDTFPLRSSPGLQAGHLGRGKAKCALPGG